MTSADETVKTVLPTTSDPRWLVIARKYLGVREYDAQRPGPLGELSNPVVEAWQREAGIKRPDDEIPWCAAFLTHVMLEAGFDFRTSSARAWAKFGKPITAPQPGAIVVLWRESPLGPHGHVGFFVREDEKGIWILAGNQGNAVTVKPFPKTRVLAYRWPR